MTRRSELLAHAGLDLLPAIAAVARPVRRVGPLRDDAFLAQPLRAGEHRRPVVHVIRVEDRRGQTGAVEHVSEQALALIKSVWLRRCRAQVCINRRRSFMDLRGADIETGD